METKIKVSNKNQYGERYHARIITTNNVSQQALNRVNDLFEIKTDGYSLYKVSDCEIGIMELSTQSKSFTIPYPASKIIKKQLNQYLELASMLLEVYGTITFSKESYEHLSNCYDWK